MQPDSRPFATVLPWLFFLMLLVFVIILPRLLLAPLLLRVAESFGLSYDRASRIFLFGSIGFVLGLLSSGFVSSWLRHRLTIVFATALAGGSLLGLSVVGHATGFHLLFGLMNFASGLYPGSGIASVTALVPHRRRGAALAIHESGPNLAFITAPVLVALLAPAFGWRGVFQIAGGVALGASALFALFGRASLERGEPPNYANIRLFARNRAFWVISVFFIVAATGAMGVFSVLPTYLVVEHGLREPLVNTIVGLSRVTGFASILLAGALVDRFGFAPVVTVILGTTGIITIVLGLASGWPLVAAVFLQPLLVGAYFPVGLTALSDVTPPRARNLAVALAIPLANLVGAGVAPPLIASAGAAGYFRLSFVILGVLTLASLLLLRTVRVERSPA